MKMELDEIRERWLSIENDMERKMLENYGKRLKKNINVLSKIYQGKTLIQRPREFKEIYNIRKDNMSVFEIDNIVGNNVVPVLINGIVSDAIDSIQVARKLSENELDEFCHELLNEEFKHLTLDDFKLFAHMLKFGKLDENIYERLDFQNLAKLLRTYIAKKEEYFSRQRENEHAKRKEMPVGMDSEAAKKLSKAFKVEKKEPVSSPKFVRRQKFTREYFEMLYDTFDAETKSKISKEEYLKKNDKNITH